MQWRSHSTAVIASLTAFLCCFFFPGTIFAQVNPLGAAFRHCIDSGRPPDERIKSCTLVINAAGVDPDEVAFAYTDLGMVYSAAGNHDAELAAYNKALSIRPDIWPALMDRGLLFMRRGELDLALSDYRHMREIAPQQVAMFRPELGIDYRTDTAGSEPSNMASDTREQARYAKAVEQLKQMLLHGFGDRCRSRAIAGLELNDALEDCNKALQLEASNARLLETRALVQLQLGRFPAALADCNSALAIDSRLAPALYMRGIAEHRMGRTVEGTADIASSKAIAPEFANKFSALRIAP